MFCKFGLAFPFKSDQKDLNRSLLNVLGDITAGPDV